MGIQWRIYHIVLPSRWKGGKDLPHSRRDIVWDGGFFENKSSKTLQLCHSDVADW